jgi:hypothetical protein
LEVAQQAALDRGEHPTGNEEVFQAREQFLGPGLVGSRKQLLGQACGDGIGLRSIASLCGVPLRLFLLEVAPMAPLAQAAQADAVGTWWRIGTVFEPVNKRIEGTHRGRLEGRKASDLCEARMGAQVVGPLRETFIVEEQHQQEGP